LTVAAMLRDAGMEVVLMGNALPEQIVEAAVQEGADVVGISTYCGGELVLVSRLMDAVNGLGIGKRTVFLLGGVFPPKNAPKLLELGLTGVFPPSSTREEIVNCITEAVASLDK
jgi:methylmalonyl-CoA mutase C-terminal domain/subunit